MIEGDAFALTNSHTLVDSISSCRRGASEFDAIVSYIIAHLSLHFHFKVKVIWQHVGHTLVIAEYSWSSRYVFENYPSCIALLYYY